MCGIRGQVTGTHIGTLCEAIHHQQGEVGVRRILGVLSLAKKDWMAAIEEDVHRAVHDYDKHINAF